MITFCRSQVIEAEFLDEKTVRFNGTLKDHIYSMEINMDVQTTDGAILAIEVGNGKLTSDENDMARKVSENLALPGTGGSDAHRIDEVGKWLTVFEKEIQDENQLVEELHAGRFKAVKDEY